MVVVFIVSICFCICLILALNFNFLLVFVWILHWHQMRQHPERSTKSVHVTSYQLIWLLTTVRLLIYLIFLIPFLFDGKWWQHRIISFAVGWYARFVSLTVMTVLTVLLIYRCLSLRYKGAFFRIKSCISILPTSCTSFRSFLFFVILLTAAATSCIQVYGCEVQIPGEAGIYVTCLTVKRRWINFGIDMGINVLGFFIQLCCFIYVYQLIQSKRRKVNIAPAYVANPIKAIRLQPSPLFGLPGGGAQLPNHFKHLHMESRHNNRLATICFFVFLQNTVAFICTNVYPAWFLYGLFAGDISFGLLYPWLVMWSQTSLRPILFKIFRCFTCLASQTADKADLSSASTNRQDPLTPDISQFELQGSLKNHTASPISVSNNVVDAKEFRKQRRQRRRKSRSSKLISPDLLSPTRLIPETFSSTSINRKRTKNGPERRSVSQEGVDFKDESEISEHNSYSPVICSPKLDRLKPPISVEAAHLKKSRAIRQQFHLQMLMQHSLTTIDSIPSLPSSRTVTPYDVRRPSLIQSNSVEGPIDIGSDWIASNGVLSTIDSISSQPSSEAMTPLGSPEQRGADTSKHTKPDLSTTTKTASNVLKPSSNHVASTNGQRLNWNNAPESILSIGRHMVMGDLSTIDSKSSVASSETMTPSDIHTNNQNSHMEDFLSSGKQTSAVDWTSIDAISSAPSSGAVTPCDGQKLSRNSVVEKLLSTERYLDAGGLTIAEQDVRGVCLQVVQAEVHRDSNSVHL